MEVGVAYQGGVACMKGGGSVVVMQMKGRGLVGAWPHRGCGQIGSPMSTVEVGVAYRGAWPAGNWCPGGRYANEGAWPLGGVAKSCTHWVQGAGPNGNGAWPNECGGRKGRGLLEGRGQMVPPLSAGGGA